MTGVAQEQVGADVGVGGSGEWSVRGHYRYRDVVGLLSGGGPGFSGPVSLALGPADGLLYVASRANPNQPEAVRVTRCTTDGDYVGEFGGWGEAPGQFIWVTAIAFGPDGMLYLADENTHRISVFTPEGEFLRCRGEFGAGPGRLNRPSGIAFRAGRHAGSGGFPEPPDAAFQRGRRSDGGVGGVRQRAGAVQYALGRGG